MNDSGKAIFLGGLFAVGVVGGYIAGEITKDPIEVEKVTLTVNGKKLATMDQEAALDFMKAAKKAGNTVEISAASLKVDGIKMSVPVGNTP